MTHLDMNEKINLYPCGNVPMRGDRISFGQRKRTYVVSKIYQRACGVKLECNDFFCRPSDVVKFISRYDESSINAARATIDKRKARKAGRVRTALKLKNTRKACRKARANYNEALNAGDTFDARLFDEFRALYAAAYKKESRAQRAYDAARA